MNGYKSVFYSIIEISDTDSSEMACKHQMPTTGGTYTDNIQSV